MEMKEIHERDKRERALVSLPIEIFALSKLLRVSEGIKFNLRCELASPVVQKKLLWLHYTRKRELIFFSIIVAL